MVEGRWISIYHLPSIMTWFLNPAVRRDDTFRGLFTDDEYRDVRDYAERHYQTEVSSTPLARLDTIARNCGIASILAKDETHRQGINAAVRNRPRLRGRSLPAASTHSSP